MNYKYIITGDDYKALVVHSELLYPDMKERVREKTVDNVFRYGIVEFKNPKLWLAEDYLNSMPVHVH